MPVDSVWDHSISGTTGGANSFANILQSLFNNFCQYKNVITNTGGCNKKGFNSNIGKVIRERVGKYEVAAVTK